MPNRDIIVGSVTKRQAGVLCFPIWGFEDSGGDSGDSGDSGARMIYPHARMMIEKVGCSA